VDHARNGNDGLDLALSGSHDAAIVDLMLPGRDGLSLIRELRRNRLNTPVIILSARDGIEDRVRGLQTGSDDYLTKPFAFSELLARIQALLRRAGGVAEPTRLTAADVTLDLLSRQVFRAGQPIELPPLEFALLEYLMRNAGRVVSKTMIMEHVWNYHFDPQTNVVEARICRLRDKLERGFASRLIHTVRGVGYVFKTAGAEG
jgi:two-component system OmpR family response regulator